MAFQKKKKKSDRPTHSGETGSGKGKQKFLRLALESFSVHVFSVF